MSDAKCFSQQNPVVRRTSPTLEPRLRFPHAGPNAFGPGKAELLGYVSSTGSIRRAAAELGMSYQRAWNLVNQMNALFRRPLLTVARGGGSGGGAALTPEGEEVLARYRAMQRKAEAAAGGDWEKIQALLR